MAKKKDPRPNTAWTRLDKYVREWMDGAEVIGEDADGMEGTVTLTERDEWMRDDLINGLLADEEFVEHVAAANRELRLQRRAAGECETCGHEAGGHWGPRCEEIVDITTGESIEPTRRTYGGMQRFKYLAQFDPPPQS